LLSSALIASLLQARLPLISALLEAPFSAYRFAA
jgi:hypothetical protein